MLRALQDPRERQRGIGRTFSYFCCRLPRAPRLAGFEQRLPGQKEASQDRRAGSNLCYPKKCTVVTFLPRPPSAPAGARQLSDSR